MEKAPSDVAGARLEVAARVRDILQDVDRLVAPLDERLREEADEDEEEDNAEELDDEERSDEDAGSDDEEDSDDADDSDEEDSDDAEGSAAEEDSAEEDASDDEEDSDDEESSDDEADEGDEAPDGDESLAAKAPTPSAAQGSREGTPRPKPAAPVETTIIVQTVSGLPLHIQLDKGEPVRIARDRFIIGRGAHCDLMVKSARVSREHAVVVREGAEFFIEDLESSNGTWFDHTRITRRLISDGEEYLLGGIRVTFTLR
ncbi:FHA domain-containing protein [Pyxidicoccus trucidator]|uniref:FHA domain-containing protein n=1 Tax=Pyxidicoccus trucidator TaxID=2709662 RepID=UPI001F084621|nr:FHA domain-containing protein [Pyxidicoccus trucidator]